MESDLYTLLDKYRSRARSEREKGTYFEEIAKVYFEHDDLQRQQYDQVWAYADWAKDQGISQADTGIDLVAHMADGSGYCAIQCKFYDKDYRIQKGDLDSFFTASGKKQFTRRIVMDTTAGELGKNAQAAFAGQQIDTHRIGLSDLAQSRIDWSIYARDQKVVLHPKKTLRPHQEKTLEDVKKGLATADRGKLIMACGTGKTFTGLKIAEELAGQGKRVLFLVPSLALMSQTVTKWTQDKTLPLRSFAVCSDTQVGKRRRGDDITDLEVHDLAFPATTHAEKLAEQANSSAPNDMTVVFSTYQSIQVISDAQKKYGLPAFDLIICDEAHRTTGVTLTGEDESNFVKVHGQTVIQGKKRIYMTATPRIFGDAVKTKASEADAQLCSMDDPALFGEVLSYLGFSQAVQENLLTDYKVMVLAVDEKVVSSAVQYRLASQDTELNLDDATKIIGCYKALKKENLAQDIGTDIQAMSRAIAFCRDIKASKLIEREFSAVVEEYRTQYSEETSALDCQVRHVDGTFNAKARNECLEWLNETAEEDKCRILSNARCLSEGVDVPALDAIMFLHPRKSQIDVVQSVGRVMRKAHGKKMGYVILPIGIPSGVKPDQALNNNENYKVVWQVLNALRAHDDRFDATINQAGLGEDISKTIDIVDASQKELAEITAVINDLPSREQQRHAAIGGHGGREDDESVEDINRKAPAQMGFIFDEFSKAIMAKIVKKCGTRDYWEDWATDIAKIAQTHITRLKGLVEQPGSKERQAFEGFLKELRNNLNDSVTDDEAIEMLAQHLITQPVFETLFGGYSFTQENPVSRAIQTILEVLEERNLAKESKSLEKFYNSVKRRATGIKTAQGKQRLVVELYEKFFRKAFPRMTEKLGIVYTPVEVVDFIIHSVNDVLQTEFGQTLGSQGVHIIDPFVGTGTFITRLLQSGLIKTEELAYKYKHDIHANEIVLLAYYIAAINIEAVYHSLLGEHAPFGGICLADTFQLDEKQQDMFSKWMADNSERRDCQKKLNIRVIMGNPPYSAGQNSANDNNANLAYPYLDERIRETYAKHSKMTSIKNLYDSYIRAIRWGSDRLGESGVMAYVSGSAWIERSFADGMRKILAEEFTNLYVLNLRGDIRKNMLSKGRAMEGGNIFGSGSMTGITITLFAKNPSSETHGNIYYYDIGNNLNRTEKLELISQLASVSKITAAKKWQKITPDENHDWLNQRDTSFDQFIVIGDKKDKTTSAMFETYSLGINTNRDAWCYNASKRVVSDNMERMIEFYNSEVDRYSVSAKPELKNFVNNDPTKISWSSSLEPKVAKQIKGHFHLDALIPSVYRPFQKQWLYYDGMFNHRTGQMPCIFPNTEAQNRVIHVSGAGARSGFSALMVDALPDIQHNDNGQCFPLKLYEPVTSDTADLYAHNETSNGYTVRDGITDEGLAHFQTAYPDEAISKEDIFYYIYGLLHSQEYRNRYSNNLSKQLPRIPCVKKANDFWAFTKAGRKLANLHVNYESVEPYPVNYKGGDLLFDELTNADYRVEKKWKFGGKTGHWDKTTVIYNHKITMTNIPLEAYDYVVNGKPALEWVMERQVVKTDKDSGIVNDANRYAIETAGDAAYPLKLFQRIVTVSLETMKIVRGLPRLEIEDEPNFVEIAKRIASTPVGQTSESDKQSEVA